MNDRSWPDFTVGANSSARSFPDFERQDSGQTRTWQADAI